MATEEGHHTRTIEGPHGGTVTIGYGAGSKTTDSGAKIGGAGAGVVVEGPGGTTHVAGRGVVGGGGEERKGVAAGSVHGTKTAGGAAIGEAHGVAAATGPRGTAVARGEVHGIKGPGGKAVIGGHEIAAIRHGFVGYHWYWTSGWYARYPRAWFFPGVVPATWWIAPQWEYVCGWYAVPVQPVVYDYGTNIVYQGDTVYYDDRPVANAEQFCDQAAQIADAGAAAPDNEEWLPLGTFTLLAQGQTTSDKVLQLAVNKEGSLRGNLHDALTDKVTQLVGAVDKKSQRVAFRPAGSDWPVVECGLWNLTQDSLQVLIHFDKDRAEPRTLVRLSPPDSPSEGNN